MRTQLSGARSDVLEHVARPEVRLCVWRRTLPSALSASLLGWARAHEARFDEPAVGPEGSLEGALAGFAHGDWREWMLEDLARRVADFRRIAQTNAVRVIFGAVRGDQCRKFHTDRLRLRLITTYAGPGTQWVTEAGVRRVALVAPAACPEQANREIVKHERFVRNARAGDVLLMKGAWNGSHGLVHRSPPIEAARLLRLVLVVST